MTRNAYGRKVSMYLKKSRDTEEGFAGDYKGKAATSCCH